MRARGWTENFNQTDNLRGENNLMFDAFIRIKERWCRETHLSGGVPGSICPQDLEDQLWE